MGYSRAEQQRDARIGQINESLKKISESLQDLVELKKIELDDKRFSGYASARMSDDPDGVQSEEV